MSHLTSSGGMRSRTLKSNSCFAFLLSIFPSEVKGFSRTPTLLEALAVAAAGASLFYQSSRWLGDVPNASCEQRYGWVSGWLRASTLSNQPAQHLHVVSHVFGQKPAAILHQKARVVKDFNAVEEAQLVVELAQELAVAAAQAHGHVAAQV
jgi:hypothetical protein